MFSAFNPSKCTHTWSSGQPTLRRSWGFGALPRLTSVVDSSCQSQDLNPQPWVSSPALYPLGHDCPTTAPFNPESCRCCRTLQRVARCSCSSLLTISKSSKYTTTFRSFIRFSLIRWKIEGAELMPNAKRL